MTTAPILTEARRLFDAGLTLLPNDSVAKYPKGETGWQEAFYDWPTIARHMQAGGALGLRMGDNDAEAVDVDVKYWTGDDQDELRQLYEGLVNDHDPDLLSRLVIQETRSGGRHYAYRCPGAVEGNLKLAKRKLTDAEREAEPDATDRTLIETRGTGGQIMIAPSEGYTVLQGDLANIPEITPDERALLLKCARMLTQIAPPSPIDVQVKRLPRVEGVEQPGDLYNRNGGIEYALQRLQHGNWDIERQRGDVLFLRRPGKAHGVSATFGYTGPGVLHVFSSNASPFEADTSYTPFAIRALLDFGGDYTATAKRIAEEHGLVYYPEGEPVEQGGALYCPTHGKLLRSGNKAGWFYCSHPVESSETGYCTFSARVPGYVVPEQARRFVDKPATEQHATEPPSDERPSIDRTTMDLPALTAKAWHAVIEANNPPTLFRRNGELVRLETTDDGARKLTAVDTRRMMGILARAARWYRVTVTKQGTFSTDTTPPAAVVDDCMVNIDERMPAIARIVQTPTIGPAGELFLTPGYHEAGRLFYDPPCGVAVPAIPEQPTAADVARAKALILGDLLVDFPFVSDADRAHAVALFLLPFVREYINGPTPLHLVEAPTMGSGKGLLAETLLYPALGATPSPMAEAGDDDEWRKRITSALLSGPAAIYIDNLNKMLASGALALALTAREYTDRVLGSSDQIRLPVRCVWVAAANNPALSTEISRRCIRIRIDPRTDKPWQREGFKHPKLRAWVKEQHGNLIWAALVLCKHGLAHGQPGQSLGSYEAWSEVMGRILQAAGIPGFLGNLDALYDRADAEGAAWRALISAWWEKHQSTPQPSSDLYPLVSDAGADDLISGKDDTGRKKSFGKALARVVDRVFSIDTGGETRRIQLAEGGTRHKSKLWKLMPVEEGGLGGLGGFSHPTRETLISSPRGVRENPQNTQNPPAQMPPKSSRYLALASRYAAATGEALTDGIWQENELDELEQHVVAYERRVSVHTPGPHDRVIDPEGWLTYENTDTTFSEFTDVPIDEEEL